MPLTKTNFGPQNFNRGISNEWIETNGLGGWASSTLIGCNTRRYHGLLVAATHPPAERMNLVNKLDESILIGGERFELGANDYGSEIHPKGFAYLYVFKKELFPEWTYKVNEIVLKKTVCMVNQENTTIILYHVLSAPAGKFELELLPLLSVRGYHSLSRSNEAICKDSSFENSILQSRLYEDAPEVFIKIPQAGFTSQPGWYYNFNYSAERERGLDYIEDLYSPGKFSLTLEKGDVVSVILSTENPSNKNAFELYAKEKERKSQLLNKQPKEETLQQLLLAADQFVVKRGEDLKTIIAGYHWFTDWARDTMISLPGLCLSTGRHEDAKKILTAFAKSVSMGMLPNRFQDNNQPPVYNNVDGTLWYFIAIYKYLVATGDQQFVLEELLPVLKDIIDWHFKGTRYNIHVDEDGLLYSGEAGYQLTWMDAKEDDWVVTPRMGKPVEIQALWYNALRIFANLLRLNGQEQDAAMVEISAEKAKTTFNSIFWFEEGGYLFDVFNQDGVADASLRPNQLFAISLPFPLIEEKEKAEKILSVVAEKLYTPVGLRTLTPDDPHYAHTYEGNTRQRDGAYHQGTVWSWLLGPYADAIFKTEGKGKKLIDVFENFKPHLSDACIGGVSEIFDADPPHHPRGCVAQAWGVAEMLRIIKEYELVEMNFNVERKINGADMMQRLAE